MNKKVFFEVILNGQIERIEWTQQDHFIADNLRAYAFGNLASGEAPIKAVFTFKKTGQTQAFRGDRFTGKPVDMIRSLQRLARKHHQAGDVHEVRIYDNRHLLPIDSKLILHWHETRGTLINLLPIYSGEFDLKRKP